jgi:hypothetical protein
VQVLPLHLMLLLLLACLLSLIQMTQPGLSSAIQGHIAIYMFVRDNLNMQHRHAQHAVETAALGCVRMCLHTPYAYAIIEMRSLTVMRL